MTTGIRKPGEFCWINMITPDLAASRDFFGKLLGWTFFEMPGMGFGVKVGASNIGGMFDQHAPSTPPGTPAFIGTMVKVENADATAEKVKALGGTARPAFDIGDAGRMAVCHDPNGAEFDIWEAKKMLGTDVDSTKHGAPSWSETITSDGPRAATFYSALFGWKADAMTGLAWEYTVFTRGAERVAGLMQRRPDMGQMPSHWATHFTVDDVDAAARDGAKLGGKLFMPLRDIPGVGRFCGISSPQGVDFYTIQYSR